jgi:hypothetical protein
MENGKQGAFATSSDGCIQEGLTKREYFAGLAMQGILAKDSCISDKLCAEHAIVFADELLKQLENE